MRTKSSASTAASPLASPGMSAPFSCQRIARLELVSEPSSSAKQPTGSMKTSVLILEGSAMLNSPWFSQNFAVSVSRGSMLTSHFSFAKPSATLFLFGVDHSGL